MGSAPASIVELALAVSAQPVSVDHLVEWGLVRPSELIAWLDVARAEHLVEEAEVEGRGHYRLAAQARPGVLAKATLDDFRVLARQPALVPALLETARREAAQRSAGMAAALYRAVFEAFAPERFPGGARQFVGAIAESVRLYRGIAALIGDLVERAIEVATDLGDLPSQALLLAASAMSFDPRRPPQETEAMLDRAREAAEAVGGTVRVEVLVYTAVYRVFSGRLRDAIAAFESLLGDVPMDLLTADGALLVDPDALCVLAVAYSEAGQHPRALELLHRLRSLAERLGRPAIVEQASLFLLYLDAARGATSASLGEAERRFEQFSTASANPLVAWLAALACSLLRARGGRLSEARSAFEAGAVAWKRAGSPPIGLWSPYEIHELLEAAGDPPQGELDVVAQAERAAALPLIHQAGLGHRFLARRMARDAGTDDELDAAADRLDQAIALLRRAGAAHDLAQALDEAAAIAERRHRAESVARYRLEAAAARPTRASGSAHDMARLRSVVLALGRLPATARRDGFWGEIAARLCQGLGAERCALVELGPEPRLLAARGGTRSWQESILGRAEHSPDAPEVTSAAGGVGQLVLIPFEAPDLDQRGIVALENVHAAPLVGPRDAELFEELAVQLGVLLGNVTMWQELVRARERLEQENRYFRENVSGKAARSQMVAHSPPMREVMGLVSRVAPSNTAVLITGETGVGKELVAHEIHRQSERRRGPFIAVHIAALPSGLVASGLFGHERGAFTGATEQMKGRFELADEGTILLDEVGELSLDDQVKLLRVLQEGTFERVGGTRPLRSDFRLLAATNRDLAAEVRAGRFRSDLYFRLSAFPIRVPPLRERREEIPTLALLFMERVAQQRGIAFEGIGEADMERLCAWDWPGNVRELEHIIERASLLSEPPRLRIPSLERGLAQAAPPPQVDDSPDRWVTLAESERRYVKRVLEHTAGRVAGKGGAAEILGLGTSTLNFRIRKLGLSEALRKIRARRARA